MSGAPHINILNKYIQAEETDQNKFLGRRK